MYNIIARVMDNLKIEDVQKFALTKNINLDTNELTFVYEFIKKNWEAVIQNPNLLNLERYKDKFSPENFSKIQKLFIEYSTKYQKFLH